MSDKILLKTILAFVLALVITLGTLLAWIYFYDSIEPYLGIIDHNPTISGLALIVLGAVGIMHLKPSEK
jgi:hypothetical protein